MYSNHFYCLIKSNSGNYFVILFACILAILLTGCSSKYERLYNSKPGFYSYISGNIHSKNIIDEYYSQVYVTPASCQKVVTSLISLKTLGPEYRYKTQLFVTKKGNKIHDIIIKFSGDPVLMTDDLISLLKPLQKSKINGHIFLDASIFKTLPHSPNLMIDDIGKKYAAPVSAINIDKNLIEVKLYPGKLGKLASIHTELGYVANSAVITNDEESCIKLTWNDGVINATGNINSQDHVLEFKISPQDYDKYILNKVSSVLSSLQIKGRVKIIKNDKLIDQKAQIINKIESLPLSEIIKPSLKSSDNLVVDSIYLSVIHDSSKEEIKDWHQGNNIIQELLKKHFEVDAKNALFVDGSGLSRYNRIQPLSLFLLLKKGFEIPEFLDALAKPGEENSTLEKRLKLSNNIIAKTGRMSGISCLCGYLNTPRKPRAFVFIGNSFSPPHDELYNIIDSFINKNIKKQTK